MIFPFIRFLIKSKTTIDTKNSSRTKKERNYLYKEQIVYKIKKRRFTRCHKNATQ